jgi:hypothetical protein
VLIDVVGMEEAVWIGLNRVSGNGVM